MDERRQTASGDNTRSGARGWQPTGPDPLRDRDTYPARRRIACTRAAASLLALAVGWITPSTAGAASTAYSDTAPFASAVPGGVASVDFEALSNGTLLSGTTQTAPGAGASIVLPPPVPDVLNSTGPPLQLRVVKNTGDNPASSGSNSIGVDDAGNFHALASGSVLAFSFTEPTTAFGLTLVTPEEPGGALFDGDAVLNVPGHPSAPLVVADGQLLGTFGGRTYRAYFMGLVSTSAFTSASLDFGPTTPPSGFFFNVDDLSVPAPEPGQGLALIAGSTLIAMLRRRGAPERRHAGGAQPEGK